MDDAGANGAAAAASDAAAAPKKKKVKKSDVPFQVGPCLGCIVARALWGGYL